MLPSNYTGINFADCKIMGKKHAEKVDLKKI
jgi:hypothetical protein